MSKTVESKNISVATYLKGNGNPHTDTDELVKARGLSFYE